MGTTRLRSCPGLEASLIQEMEASRSPHFAKSLFVVIDGVHILQLTNEPPKIANLESNYPSVGVIFIVGDFVAVKASRNHKVQ